jgi:hypothetical protein
MVLLVSEPAVLGAPKTLRQAVVEPFPRVHRPSGLAGRAAGARRSSFSTSSAIRCATALATPFYLDMGFSKTDIGLIAKHAGLWPAVFGGLLGGLWMVRLGINRALWLFGVVQMVTILGFAWLAWRGCRRLIGARPGRAGHRDCCRVPRRRPGYRRFRRLHRACHQSGLHGHPVCPVHQPGRRSPDLHQRHGRRAGRVAGLGQLLHPVFLLAAPGMLLLLKVAPWNETPRRRDTLIAAARQLSASAGDAQLLAAGQPRLQPAELCLVSARVVPAPLWRKHPAGGLSGNEPGSLRDGAVRRAFRRSRRGARLAGDRGRVRNRLSRIPGGRSKALPAHARRSAGGVCGDCSASASVLPTRSLPSTSSPTIARWPFSITAAI